MLAPEELLQDAAQRIAAIPPQALDEADQVRQARAQLAIESIFSSARTAAVKAEEADIMANASPEFLAARAAAEAEPIVAPAMNHARPWEHKDLRDMLRVAPDMPAFEEAPMGWWGRARAYVIALLPRMAGGSGKSELQFVSAAELLAQESPTPEWVWEYALVKGAVSLFAKKPKAGGSTLTYQLVKAIADRETEFLGCELNGGPVVYASEEGHATLSSTFPRHTEIYLATRESAWPKPTWRELVATAAAKVHEVEAVLAVVDTFSFWNGLGPDAEKDSGSVQPLMDALIKITQTGCAVWLPHHHRKSGGEDGDAIRGTTAIAGGVDCFCELERIEDAPLNHRRLVITPRWKMPPVLVLDYNQATGYRAIGHAVDREKSGEIGWGERLLDAIPLQGGGITLGDLEEVIGSDKRKWHRALDALLTDQRIERLGEGVRGAPYRYLQKPSQKAVPTAGTERTES